MDLKLINIILNYLRGNIFFALSMIFKKIEPILRQKANLGNWLII